MNYIVTWDELHSNMGRKLHSNMGRKKQHFTQKNLLLCIYFLFLPETNKNIFLCHKEGTYPK